MDRRSNNIAIFQDSMDLIKANQKLQQAVQFSIQNQKLYVPSQAIALPEPEKFTLQNDCFIQNEASKPPLHMQKPGSRLAS